MAETLYVFCEIGDHSGVHYLRAMFSFGGFCITNSWSRDQHHQDSRHRENSLESYKSILKTLHPWIGEGWELPRPTDVIFQLGLLHNCKELT